MSSVVLVPVGGAIVPDCDSALSVLQSRGYEVRKVRGYSQVDVARCQMATDALSDGFDELIWIDSDVVFDPDDIERLRAHKVPFVCGIYPKKGPREFACNYLPGTDKLVMGEKGGLSELLYTGFGFNYTHRSVYETVQEKLNLPVCNEQFGSPLVPFFMPLVATNEPRPWYLGEDYAFCERARQCGFKIHVDTRIRLWHVGTYRYSWEDAGGQRERFGDYQFTTGTKWNHAATVAPESPGRDNSLWNQLRQVFPWPEVRPAVLPNRRHGWLSSSYRQLLSQTVTGQTKLVVELGAWLGLATRFILDRAPQTRLISIDTWKGYREHHRDPASARLLPTLYERFLTNCWEYRDRLTPLRMPTLDGLRRIAELGIQPDVISIDADHQFDAVKAELELSLKLFPDSTIIGDDWDWEEVRKAVESVAATQGLAVKPHGTAWELKK